MKPTVIMAGKAFSCLIARLNPLLWVYTRSLVKKVTLKKATNVRNSIDDEGGKCEKKKKKSAFIRSFEKETKHNEYPYSKLFMTFFSIYSKMDFYLFLRIFCNISMNIHECMSSTTESIRINLVNKYEHC